MGRLLLLAVGGPDLRRWVPLLQHQAECLVREPASSSGGRHPCGLESSERGHSSCVSLDEGMNLIMTAPPSINPLPLKNHSISDLSGSFYPALHFYECINLGSSLSSNLPKQVQVLNSILKTKGNKQKSKEAFACFYWQSSISLS